MNNDRLIKQHIHALPPGGSLVSTDDLRLIRTHVHAVVKSGGVMFVEGAPGTSKSFSAAQAVASLDCPVYWIELVSRAQGKDVPIAMWEALNGLAGNPGDLASRNSIRDLLRQVARRLTDHHCCFVMDEAQFLDSQMISYLRFLMGQQQSNFGLVLLGYGVGAIVRNDPCLDSRIERRIYTSDFLPSERREILDRFHPLLARTSDEVLDQLALLAKGNFRQWKHAVRTALELGADPAKGVNGDLARRVIFAISGSTR